MNARSQAFAAVLLALVAGSTARSQEAQEAPQEVTVRGRQTEAERLEDSAEAVQVIDTRKAKKETADLGEVLARTQGIGVRREGGLGSGATISLNGLHEDQIRFFVDGVPLELAGYPFELVNVPVNLVERVEVYRGVVPIRFGADALGGAINVVTDEDYETHAGSSYQLGSFGVHRMTVNARYRDYPTGLVGSGAMFMDMAQNDFEMSNRELMNPDGSSTARSVPRFNDAYHAYGGNVEAGIVEQPWARKLLMKVFAAVFDKELQHNPLMTIPYAEVAHGQITYGVTARYETDLAPELELSLLASYAYQDVYFRDMSIYKYNWLGERVRLVGRERAPGEPARGEIYPGDGAIYESTYDETFYARAGLDWTIVQGHIARLSVTPQLTFRSKNDHVPARVDTLEDSDSKVQKVVAGAEYELNAFEERLSNIAFGKLYYVRLIHEGRPERTVSQDMFRAERDMVRAGGGDALRYRLADWVSVKASYEYAIRVPRPDEWLGDGALIDPDSQLEPERSHNFNAGPQVELKRTAIGDVTFDSNVFVRDVENMIVLMPGQAFASYSNVDEVTGAGIENALTWDSPKRFVSLDGTITYQDFRNRTTTGTYQKLYGMRIPSRPYLFASWGARGRAPRLLMRGDALEPFYHGRYVHEFERAWDLVDAPSAFLTVPAQVSHAVGVTYSVVGELGNVSCTIEIDNLTDSRLYDYFGVQRPGRSLAIKVVGEI